VEEAAEDWRMNDIKALKADMLDRKVAFLSGGEKVWKLHMIPLLLLF
jgi:hypothetical protein